MRIKLITIWIAIFIFASGIQSAQALIQLFPDQSNQVACRGGRDFGTFLSSIITYDDFMDYWNDILVRYNANICHYQDIDGLVNRIKGVRQQLRSAFYVCGDTTGLKATYYDLEAETYYLRNFIKYTKTPEGNYIVVNEQKLFNDMKAYFVDDKGFFDTAHLTRIFNQFKTRYQSRLATYNNCTDPTWQNLVDKWNEFKDDAGGVSSALKQAGSSMTKRWDRMANTPMNLNRDFWGGFLDVKINGLPPKEALSQIAEEFSRNMPSGSTISQLQAASATSDEVYAYEASEQTYLAEYKMLYMESSAEFLKLMLARLDALDTTIKDTFPFQNQTIQCVKGIVDKQC
jgi:hypothetical protein